MSGEMQVRPTELTSHAGHVDQVAGDVRTAAGAAHQTNMDVGAYGILCQFLPPFIGTAGMVAAAAMDQVAQNLTTGAENLRVASTDYNSTDASSSSSINSAGGGLTGGGPR